MLNVKVIGFIGAFATLLFGYLYITSSYESKGYNRAVAEIQKNSTEAIALATKKAFAEAEDRIEKALKVQRLLSDADIKRVKGERKIEKVTEYVINEVSKIKYVEGECSSLTSNDISLLNNSINNVNGTTKP